ncbi:MAG: type II toxin-antitoxin system VapC family toxin [Deltaproteobacteria bacterium]|nr:type II toxin-antitoxin system VapC family toxin [Deltaproteobacteria bacterium]
MLCYMDTSAIAKKYLEESGALQVEEYFAQSEGVFTTALTRLELASLIERAKRSARINSPMYHRIVAAVEADYRLQIITLLAINEGILALARRLIIQRRLRVQDAIQLATAIVTNRSLHGGEVQFVCADHALLGAARLEGLRCRDVSK